MMKPLISRPERMGCRRWNAEICSSVLLLGVTLLTAEPVKRGQDLTPIPQPPERDRYAALMEKSPFAVSTAAPETVAPTESFASNWRVSGLSKSRASDGSIIHTVFIQSRDLTTRFTVSGELPNADGIAIASVEEAAIPTRSVVVLRKGSETARVEFDQATVSASLAAPGGGAAAPPGASNVRPTGVSPAPGAIPKSGAIRPSSIPRPNPSAIPRPNAAPGANPAPAQPGSSSPRRVRSVEEPK